MPSRNSGERPKTGEEALQWLKVGNDRYVKSLNNPGNAVATRHELISEQDPFAIILGCSDARVPVEIVFDQGLGDLFVIRVAGNVVAPSQIGSIEFAVEKFDTRLVVVLGHSNCGAVTACVDALMNPEQNYTTNLQSIVDRIRPSVYNLHELATAKGGEVDKQKLIDSSISANVRMSVSQLKHASRLLEDMNRTGDLLIVGAEYNLDTGEVEFLPM
ncbi:carbonic anhydrase [Psychrobacter sanguinis]|uniref:Carbonic anhydrase n=1 Tax=Psychrobacter sanguinis TaxID=861445 RepID=A0A844LXW8_9GAMM|nr:carbonic anhydrase [Psychrobacter sanguinis]MUG31425.1 carbonic anhydrase [Psychrobacter sanguinis]